jgi:hypothetical protein
MDELAAAARAMPGVAEFRPHPSGRHAVVIVAGTAEPYVLVLSRVASMVGDTAGPERQALLQRIVATAVETNADAAAAANWDTAQHLLLRTSLIPTRYEARHPTGGYVGEEILPGVAEAAVLDRPTSMQFVDRRRCEHWQVAAAEVLAAARRNLVDAPEPGRWNKLRNVPLWELENADEYSAARLLQPGWLARHRPPGRGQLVIGIPDRTMIVAGWLAELKPYLAAISGQTLAGWREARDPVSPVLYTLRDQHLVPLHRFEGKAAAALRTAQATLAITEYRQQAQHGRPPRAGDRWAPIAPATINTMPATATTWPGDTTGDLLPHADFVAVAGPGLADPILVPWDAFTSRVDLERVDTMPVRWRTTAPLDPAVAAELATTSETPR